jgi:hypothetical protein
MGEIRVGTPDVAPDAPSHVKGVRAGNWPKPGERYPGHNDDGTATARRSTSVAVKRHEPIVDSMPNLPPG